MQTFENYPYKQPNMKEINGEFNSLLKKLSNAGSIEAVKSIIKEINRIRSSFSTMMNIAYIRATIDTTDEFYQNESDYFDKVEPEFGDMETRYYQELIHSSYRKELEEEYGNQLFQLAECKVKSFSPEIIPLLQEENKLMGEYARLIASAQIVFQGKSYTLAQIELYTVDSDREVRKAAIKASSAFYANHKDTLDHIFDLLVKVRHEMAIKLGYKNFVELCYLWMNRIDYNADMVASFRKQVRDYIVPLCNDLYKKQSEQIGIDSLKFYDEGFHFKSGNASPKGSSDWIITKGQKMYAELSTDTNQFYNYMVNHHLMDLEAKENKEIGGYCTYIEDYQSPFIFANFNGTANDINVLTHEFGHSFQKYCSRNFEISEYYYPTKETAEIASMSMEFFTWPWIKLFFEGDADKYKYAHLKEAVTMIPYVVAVDEFQHLVYENPDWTPTERHEAWRKLEEVYLPHPIMTGILI